GVGNNTNDLVTRPGLGVHPQSLTGRLLIRQIPSRERLVDNGNREAADTIAAVEVSPTQDGDAHRLEPARCDGVTPHATALVLWEQRTVADGHAVVAEPAAPGQQPYSRSGCRPDARHRRRGIPKTLDMRAALLQRNAGRSKVQLHDNQWLRCEAKRQLTERRERAQKESRRDDQDERYGKLRDDERTAHREAPVARDRAACPLESVSGSDAVHADHRREAGADRT